MNCFQQILYLGKIVGCYLVHAVYYLQSLRTSGENVLRVHSLDKLLCNINVGALIAALTNTVVLACGDIVHIEVAIRAEHIVVDALDSGIGRKICKSKLECASVIGGDKSRRGDIDIRRAELNGISVLVKDTSRRTYAKIAISIERELTVSCEERFPRLAVLDIIVDIADKCAVEP